MMPWLKRLQRRFSPRRMLLGRETNQVLEGGDGDALACVVSRGLCLFLPVDASKAPEKERRNLVALAVRRAAPFPDPDFGVAWLPGGHGAVWYWSRSRIADLLAERQVQARKIEFVPEAVLVGAPAAPDESRVDLLELQEGFVARAWHQGRLVADRWWPQLPAQDEWQAFLRACGHLTGTPPTPTPAAGPVAIAARPWNARSRVPGALTGLSALDNQLPKVAAGIGVALLVVAAMQTGSILRSGIDIWRARQAAQSLDEPLRRILAARESADRDMAASRQLLALQPPRGTVALLAETARLLPAGAQVKQWNLSTPDRIEVTLVMPEPDPQKLVATWEESPMFANVSTELQPRGGEIVVRADVIGNAGTVAP